MLLNSEIAFGSSHRGCKRGKDIARKWELEDRDSKGEELPSD